MLCNNCYRQVSKTIICKKCNKNYCKYCTKEINQKVLCKGCLSDEENNFINYDDYIKHVIS